MSEIILGSVLRALAAEFPRQSYRLMTKVGRYGPLKEDFDYSPQSIRLSVMRSLQRLNSTYLDVVFLHDVEFIASPVWPIPYCGDFERVLNDKEGRADWGLLPGKEGKAWGAGDETILAAVRELFQMKSEGLIRAIGISGMNGPTSLMCNTFWHDSDVWQAIPSRLFCASRVWFSTRSLSNLSIPSCPTHTPPCKTRASSSIFPTSFPSAGSPKS